MSIHTVEINTPDSFAVVEIRQGPAGAGGGGSATWGGITGTLSDQTDLQSALDGKAPSSGIAPSAITGTAVITTDPRLSDARTPTAHTHVVSDITPVSGQHLIGRHAGGSGAAQEVTVGNGLEFQGSGIRRSALTGDVAASAGSNSTTIANDAVSNTKLANMAQATIKGRAFGAGTGDPQDLTATEARTAIGAAATVHTHVSADITDATSAATPSTLVLRDGSGGASLSGLTTSGPVLLHKGGSSDLFSFDFLNVYYGPGSASAHRTALGAGTTGAELFGAATAAAARATLGMTTQFVYATAGETITDANFSTPGHNARATVTTPGDDLELFLPVEANSFYEMAFQIGFANYGNDGIKAQFNLPSFLLNPDAGWGAVTGINPIAAGVAIRSGSNIILPTVTGINTPRAYSGVLVFSVGATPGNIKFQWSKNSTGASASLLRSPNSWMALRKIGSI